MDSEKPDDIPEFPDGAKGGRTLRFLLDAAIGAIPLAGGVLSAGAGAWSERDQERINDFLKHWLEMLLAEMKEKRQTILEITARLDMHDEKIAERVKSTEYQALLRKAFRDWAGTESEEKRKLVRNLLSNAAAASFVSDDVVKLFLEWIRDYSELHFSVIGAIYNDAGVTRAGIWQKFGRAAVREDSADADLFKLIIHDLSTGRIIRQHRETDYAGNFIAKQHRKGPALPKGTQRTMKSAFDDEEEYELTSLGQQFVHYAMTDVPPKIEFKKPTADAPKEEPVS
jgi:hypothetical protein